MIQKIRNTVVTTETRRFTAWEDIVDSVAEAFRMNEAEKESLRDKKLAQLIASLPYLAGCEDAGRTAITHLGTYILGTRIKTVANCQPTDGAYLMRRLEMLNNFVGGDSRIIERGMNLIALNMISDYANDVVEDRAFGKFNPVDSGLIDFEAEKTRLTAAIEAVPSMEMDEILTVKDALLDGW